MTNPHHPGLKLQRQRHTAIVTLSNPPAHTWTAESLAALKMLVKDLEADRGIYALVITGEGGKFFSAGADLKLFEEGDKAVASIMARRFGEAFEALASFSGITVAAINGFAMGGGLECALACDMRIAEEHAVMALPEASVGLLPCAGGTQWLAWTVGESWAKRMILLGERVDARKALDIGLIDHIVASGQALERALVLTESVGRQSPKAVGACKRLIQSARGGHPQQTLAAEREAFLGLFETVDQREGVAAFLAKRTPEWRNA
jgi:enoyl-CoA hydratase/carnithine racemase